MNKSIDENGVQSDGLRWQVYAGPLALLVIGCVLAYLLPPAGLAVLLIGFVWLCIVSLPGALAVYIIAAPFPFGLALLHHHLALSDLMALIMAARLVVTSWRAHRWSAAGRDWFMSPFWRPMALLLILSVLSVITAIAPATTVIKILEYVEFFVVLVAVAHAVPFTERTWRVIIAALVGIAVLLALYGLYQFLFQVGSPANVVDVHHVRADAVFGQPNPFGGFESMVFAFIAALMGYGPDWARRWWMWVAASLVALGVIDSFSRGAWVASVGAIGFMGVVAWAIRGRRMINRRFVIPGIFIPVLSFIAVDLLGHLNLSHSAISVVSRQTTGERLQSTVGAVFHPTGHFATAKRLLIWKDALRATRLHPILGVGLGGFHRFAQLHPMRGLVAAPPMAHNLYLEWGADLGILGIVVALWLEWSWVRKSIGVLKSSSGSLTPFEWAMGLGAFGAIVSFVVHDWVDLMIDHGVIVPLLLGLAVVWRLADARGRASRLAESHPEDGG